MSDLQQTSQNLVSAIQSSLEGGSLVLSEFAIERARRTPSLTGSPTGESVAETLLADELTPTFTASIEALTERLRGLDSNDHSEQLEVLRSLDELTRDLGELATTLKEARELLPQVSESMREAHQLRTITQSESGKIALGMFLEGDVSSEQVGRVATALRYVREVPEAVINMLSRCLAEGKVTGPADKQMTMEVLAYNCCSSEAYITALCNEFSSEPSAEIAADLRKAVKAAPANAAAVVFPVLTRSLDGTLSVEQPAQQMKITRAVLDMIKSVAPSLSDENRAALTPALLDKLRTPQAATVTALSTAYEALVSESSDRDGVLVAQAMFQHQHKSVRGAGARMIVAHAALDHIDDVKILLKPFRHFLQKDEKLGLGLIDAVSRCAKAKDLPVLKILAESARSSRVLERLIPGLERLRKGGADQARSILRGLIEGRTSQDVKLKILSGLQHSEVFATEDAELVVAGLSVQTMERFRSEGSNLFNGVIAQQAMEVVRAHRETIPNEQQRIIVSTLEGIASSQPGQYSNTARGKASELLQELRVAA